MESAVWFLFVALLVGSAVIDLATFRIPNAIVIAVVLLFVVDAAIHWSQVAWLSHAGSLLLVLGAGAVLYAFGQMGAGDVKLLSAVALWSGVYALLGLLLWISLCGLIGMLILLGLRVVFPRLATAGGSIPHVFTKGKGIPYAIGIGPGAVIASFSFPGWLWH